MWTSDTNANGDSLQERGWSQACCSYSCGFCDTCQLCITTLLQGTSSEQLHCCQPRLNITCSSANVVLERELLVLQGELMPPRFSLSQLSQGRAATLPALHLHWLQQAVLSATGASHFPEEHFNPGREQQLRAGYTESLLTFLLVSRKRDWEVQTLQPNSEKHKDMVQMPFCPRSRNISVWLCV